MSKMSDDLLSVIVSIVIFVLYTVGCWYVYDHVCQFGFIKQLPEWMQQGVAEELTHWLLCGCMILVGLVLIYTYSFAEKLIDSIRWRLRTTHGVLEVASQKAPQKRLSKRKRKRLAKLQTRQEQPKVIEVKPTPTTSTS